MSFSAPDPVVSGQAYHVVSVKGSEPVTLEQFIGEADFTVSSLGAGSSQIRGQGCAQDEGVRFQEKDVENSGKDIRVWHVADDGGEFSATAIGAF